jgi:hypothetical protein
VINARRDIRTVPQADRNEPLLQADQNRGGCREPAQAFFNALGAEGADQSVDRHLDGDGAGG